jgi:hypothetical protein
MTDFILKKTSIFLLALFFTTSSFAGSSSDAAGLCFANSTTGKDRINLAKFYFTAMAVHPEVTSLSNITAENTDQINKAVGALYTRLLTVDCNKEIKEAVKLDGPTALPTTFATLGRLAMQELVGNPAVNIALAHRLDKHVDPKIIKAAIEN